MIYSLDESCGIIKRFRHLDFESLNLVSAYLTIVTVEQLNNLPVNCSCRRQS